MILSCGALYVMVFPLLSVTVQRTSIPSQVALAVAVVEAVVRPFQLLHEVAPDFLYFLWYFRPELRALTVKVTFSPAFAITAFGCVVILSYFAAFFLETAFSMAVHVFLPTLPSVLILFFFWNFLTAAAVFLPYTPSAETLYPSVLRFF